MTNINNPDHSRTDAWNDPGDGWDADSGALEEFASGGIRHGQPSGAPYLSDSSFDGTLPIIPRRFELLNDADAHLWFTDLYAWSQWAIDTFRLHRWVPKCWMRHPELVEEMSALWVEWTGTNLASDNVAAPGAWLRNLDLAIDRITRRWQVPCKDTHREPVPTPTSHPAFPVPRPWWSDPDFDGPNFHYT